MTQEITQDLNREQLEGHYKKHMDRQYIGSHDLMKKDGTYQTVKLTIDGVFARQIYNTRKRESEKCMVISFKGKEKDFIANPTNQGLIEQATGIVMAEKWVGQQIVIGVEDVKVGLKTKKGLRVKPGGEIDAST